MLEHLPLNVLAAIIIMLDQKDTQALSTVSKLLYGATAPFLLRCLDIPIIPSDILSGIRTFFEGHVKDGRALCLRLTRELRFIIRDPIVCDSLELREPRHGSRMPSSSHQMSRIFPKSFGHAARLILDGLESGKLTAFVWEFPWIPKEVLGYDGYIPKSQPQLNSIMLSTLPVRSTELKNRTPLYEQNVDGLVRLRCLRSLSWNGIHSRRQIHILNICLQQNSNELQILRLNFSKEARIDLSHIACLSGKIGFPNLHTLSLENISFLQYAVIPTSLFGSPSLHSLKLSGCADASVYCGIIRLRSSHTLKLIRAGPESSRLMNESDLTALLSEGTGRLASAPII